MAGRKSSVASSLLSPTQAVFVVERALAERKLAPSDIRRYMGNLTDEIRALESRITQLKDAAAAGVARAVTRVATMTRRRGTRSSAKKGRTRRKSAGTAEPKSPARMLQGQYLGFMKQVPERERAKFKKLREKDGIEKAVSAMRMRLGK